MKVKAGPVGSGSRFGYRFQGRREDIMARQETRRVLSLIYEAKKKEKAPDQRGQESTREPGFTRAHVFLFFFFFYKFVNSL